jgi:hypothetical protein
MSGGTRTFQRGDIVVAQSDTVYLRRGERYEVRQLYDGLLAVKALDKKYSYMLPQNYKPSRFKLFEEPPTTPWWREE